MSRTSKAVFAFLLTLLLAGARAEDTLISPDKITGNTVNYKTATVEEGTYEKKVSANAAAYYPSRVNVRYEGAKARFVEYRVRRGSEVKKGDVLAAFTVETDEVAIAERKLQIRRAKEAREEKLSQLEAALASLRASLRDAQSADDAELLSLRVTRAELELEKYDFQSARELASREKALSELMATYENQQILSPIDGVVDDIQYLRDNEAVYNGAWLMTIYDPTEVLFSVKDEQGQTRLGMRVTVSVGPNNSRVTGVGRVVASFNAVPDHPVGKLVLVRVTEYDEDEVKSLKALTRPTAEYVPVHLENVLVVKRAALTLYGGRYYVYKLAEDGMVSKRYVNYAGGTAQTGAWLLGGALPGETLIAD